MEETMALIERSHHGDKEARDRLVQENMGLVCSIVRLLYWTGNGYGGFISDRSNGINQGN